ncbi:MAG: dephospho-CoA kinase [Clostridia bacterium]|nr:dephospho-CoA kinase [Clostridia bacterium]
MQSKLIAVTGGIGSGKSTVTKIIKRLGYAVFDLDKIYSDILKNPVFLQKLCEEIGILPKCENGEYVLDRERVSKLVFSDKKALLKLNSFTHPKIMEELSLRIKSENLEIAFCEVPLLFESGLEKYFNKIIVVMRSLEDRIAAVSNRDGKTSEQIKKIMENQFDYTNFSPDDNTIIIENNGDKFELEEKVSSIIKKIL